MSYLNHYYNHVQQTLSKSHNFTLKKRRAKRYVYCHQGMTLVTGQRNSAVKHSIDHRLCHKTGLFTIHPLTSLPKLAL